MQSRYYDAGVQRFISTDEPLFLGMGSGIYSYNLYLYCENDPVNNIDLFGYLSLGKHFWNATWFVSRTIDVVIILIPALVVLKNVLRAGKIVEALTKTAANMSRKALRNAFVEMGLKLANLTGWKTLSTLGGAVFDIIMTIVGTSLGSIIANALDKLDGRKDGYIFA